MAPGHILQTKHLRLIVDNTEPETACLESITDSEDVDYNPLIVLTDCAYLQKKEIGYLAVMREAGIINGVRVDVGVGMTDQPVNQEDFYSVPVVNNMEGAEKKQPDGMCRDSRPLFVDATPEERDAIYTAAAYMKREPVERCLVQMASRSMPALFNCSFDAQGIATVDGEDYETTTLLEIQHNAGEDSTLLEIMTDALEEFRQLP